jgi:hypothetical protein
MAKELQAPSAWAFAVVLVESRSGAVV